LLHFVFSFNRDQYDDHAHYDQYDDDHTHYDQNNNNDSNNHYNKLATEL
jgi:hypothetical protein